MYVGIGPIFGDTSWFWPTSTKSEMQQAAGIREQVEGGAGGSREVVAGGGSSAAESQQQAAGHDLTIDSTARVGSAAQLCWPHLRQAGRTAGGGAAPCCPGRGGCSGLLSSDSDSEATAPSGTASSHPLPS